MVIKIASRQSDLARIQALTFGKTLKEKHPDCEVQYHFRESLGDKNLNDPLWKMPGQGVFTEDFYEDLVEGRQDVVVHSWKDLPTEPRGKTEIFATLPRADMRDLLLFKKENFQSVKESKKLRVYSSSPRRAYNLTPFLKQAMPFDLQEVEFSSVRGNVPTRLKKLLDDDVDALIVAKAALDRMVDVEFSEFDEMKKSLKNNLEKLSWMVLPLSVNPCAAAQGALAIEIRKDRDDLKEIFSSLNDLTTQKMAERERTVLSSYGGGCHQKIGVSFLDRPFGKVKFLKGLTDAGEVLDEVNLERKKGLSWPQLKSKEDAFPVDMKDSSFFNRAPIEISEDELTGKHLWVARSNALPEGFTPESESTIWCSGVESWKKLASRGVWVNGCAEGLGEREEMKVEALADSSKEWVKLTHDQGFGGENKKATYKLIPNEEASSVKGKQYFYWASFSLFERALTLEKETVLQGFHGCGPGHTYDLICKKLEEENVSLENVAVFLSHSHWLKEIVN